MKITFKIEYYTHWGQKIYVCGNMPEIGNLDLNKASKMQYFDGKYWELSVEFNSKLDFELQYFYFIKNEDGTIKREWGTNRASLIDLKLNNILIQDQWKSSENTQNVFSSSPFSDVFYKKHLEKRTNKNQTTKKFSHKISLYVPFDIKEFDICILGNCKQFGNWDKRKGFLLYKVSDTVFETKVDLSDVNFPIEYKFGLFDEKQNKIIELESGKNRELQNKSIENKLVIINNNSLNVSLSKWRGAGVAVPVFSLRTKKSFGVGEFLDIKLLVDWAKETNQKLIQILPINDTIASHTWVDSYPYAAISVFALHPIYLNIDKLGFIDSKISKQIFENLREELNKTTQIDYEKVTKIKLRYSEEIYNDKKEEIRKDKNFNKFITENSEWLQPYAAFCYLRDIYDSVVFSKWGKHSTYSPKVLNELIDPKSKHFDKIEYHFYIQYNLNLQLIEAKKYANENGIILKGDIPIGIYRYSVDAWTNPELFDTNMQAGAPPDDFAVKGQNWGFPTYNYDEMAKDNYSWWKKRLQKLSSYFDTFRIDHILGFFRIWQIPIDTVEGVLGYFNPALPIKIDDFFSQELHFESERYCKPYVRDHILMTKFGNKSDFIKHNFLINKGFGVYTFKPEYSNQRAIEAFFKTDETTTTEQLSEINFLKKGLFDLIAEIIFIEVEGTNGKEYHPRHSLQNTNSYNELDGRSKYIVNNIYNDYFFNRQEEFWRKKAMQKLPSIKNATNMLICGEDLGMVPAVVPGVMNELGILSLEIQRMPKDPGIEFSHPNNAPYLSVVTPSSHDMSTIRGWWEENYDKSQRFFSQMMSNEGFAPYYADGWIVKEILNQHMHSPAMWSIIPIQDYIGMDNNLRLENAKDEQINIPAVIPHYWRYRIHINLEDLIKENNLNNKIKKIIVNSGR